MVNLLGAVTTNLNNRKSSCKLFDIFFCNLKILIKYSDKYLLPVELMVIVEYCKFGSIEDILHSQRRHFVDQINRAQDVIDPNISSVRTRVEEAYPSMTRGSRSDVAKAAPKNYTSAF